MPTPSWPEEAHVYTVVILAEQALSSADASRVVSLHEALAEERRYVVLIPCEDAAARVETALGSLAASEVLAAPPVVTPAVDTAAAQQEIDAEAETAVTVSVAALRGLGYDASGDFTSEDPVDAVARLCAERSADEVIVMTRPHVVAEFLHLDWASRARRRLGVPVLHLIEHEPFDAEAGAGQGVTGM